MKEKNKLDAELIVFAVLCAGLFWLLFYIWQVGFKLLK